MPRFSFDDATMCRVRVSSWLGWREYALKHPAHDYDWAYLAHHPPKPALAKWLHSYPEDAFRADLERFKIRVLFPDDLDWPPIWNHIADPPFICFVRGAWDLESLNAAIAIVGTRRPTSYGRACVEKLCRDLARYPITTISGLALGIDACVHEESLARNLRTVAILGSGLDDPHIQPSSNAHIAFRILEQGGCLLSEYPPRTEGFSKHFPERNRLIASLSCSILVIEATVNSGSLITAKLALEYGKDIFAVPGQIWSTVSEGCHELLKQGANVCTSADDIVALLCKDRSEQLVLTHKPIRAHIRDPLSQELLTLLSTPQTTDDLCVRLAIPFPQLFSLLSALELDGAIKQMDDLWIRTLP